MKQNLNYIAQNALLVYMAVLGLVYNVQGAYYLFAFLMFVYMTITGLLLLSLFKIPEFSKKIGKAPKVARKKWQRVMNIVVNVPLIIFLVWHGKVLTAGALLLSLSFMEIFWEAVDSIRKAVSEEKLTADKINKILDEALIASASRTGEDK